MKIFVSELQKNKNVVIDDVELNPMNVYECNNSQGKYVLACYVCVCVRVRACVCACVLDIEICTIHKYLAYAYVCFPNNTGLLLFRFTMYCKFTQR